MIYICKYAKNGRKNAKDLCKIYANKNLFSKIMRIFLSSTRIRGVESLFWFKKKIGSADLEG